VRLLSSRRRHPAAKALLLVAGLFLMGALYSVIAPPAQVSADTGNSQQIAEGKALFAVGCASCHGLNGEGQVGENIQGPPLAGVGAAAVDFQVSSGRMPMARPGEQAIPEPAVYDTSNISPEDLARGGELFRTNCSACHNFEGAGGALPNGKYAPPLIGLDNKRIYEAMLTGPQQMPVFDDEVLRPEDKRAIIGYLQGLHERPTDGGFALGGLGPVSEGLWAWIIGLGGLIFFAMWIAAKGAKAK